MARQGTNMFTNASLQIEVDRVPEIEKYPLALAHIEYFNDLQIPDTAEGEEEACFLSQLICETVSEKMLISHLMAGILSRAGTPSGREALMGMMPDIERVMSKIKAGEDIC
jgi:hypothetical protein